MSGSGVLSAGPHDRIRAAIAARSAALGLDAATLDVRPVLNMGGFVNRSFRVSDGRRTLFVKLADEAENRAGLEVWRRHAARLTARYRAPAMLGWLDVPGTALAGPVFDWIDGNVPRRIAGSVRRTVEPLVRALHEDAELAAALDGGAVPATCADVFERTYARRYREDLDSVEATPPPFVPADRLRWMRDESSGIARRIAADPAFAEPADRATHGDLWIDNLRIGQDGTLFVLDWDQLGRGDPVIDWAVLCGPHARDLRPATARRGLPRLPGGTAAHARLELLARATLLDWIIDPLADWIEANAFPRVRARVRRAKQRVHEEAVNMYEGVYRGK